MCRILCRASCMLCRVSCVINCARETLCSTPWPVLTFARFARLSLPHPPPATPLPRPPHPPHHLRTCLARNASCHVSGVTHVVNVVLFVFLVRCVGVSRIVSNSFYMQNTMFHTLPGANGCLRCSIIQPLIIRSFSASSRNHPPPSPFLHG